MSRMTAAQEKALREFLVRLIESIATTAPSLEPAVEKLKDLDKGVIGGIKIALQLLYGEEASNGVFEAVNSVLRDRLGYEPDMTPSLFASAAETEVLKEWITQDRPWKLPDA